MLDVDLPSFPPPVLTDAAVGARLKRAMAPRKDGSYLVPADIVAMYEDKHHGGRDKVKGLFEKSAYDPVL